MIHALRVRSNFVLILANLLRKLRAFPQGENGRGDRIRTCDICVPNAALYQAELLPVANSLVPCLGSGQKLYEEALLIKSKMINFSIFILQPLRTPSIPLLRIQYIATKPQAQLPRNERHLP